MKRLVFLLASFFVGILSFAQSKQYIRADTLFLERVGGNSELILKNGTRDSLGGVIVNIGGGRTKFIKNRKLNDSTVSIGLDTFKILGNPRAYQLSDTSFKVGPDTITIAGTGGGGTTNLDSLRSDSSVIVLSSTGTDATIAKADTSKAGVMTAADKKKLNKIEIINSEADLRTITNVSTNVIYRIIKNKIIGDFYYDPADASTADDSAMTIVGIGGKRFKRYVEDEVNVLWFGAAGTNLVDDWYPVQKALNWCVNNNKNCLFLPAGTYAIGKGLLVWKDADANGDPEFVHVKIRGQGTSYAGSSQETVIRLANDSSFALGLERCKGCVVQDLVITGPNQLNYTNAAAWHPSSTYLLSGKSNDRYSPLSGICLDPFGNNTGYPGMTRYPSSLFPASYYTGVSGNGGSTDCRFSNIVVDGFAAGIVLSPNGVTQNNESHDFDRIWFANCLNGFSTSQDQERLITLRNIKAWNSVKSVFSNGQYGGQHGDCPIVDNVNIAGNIYQIFNYSHGTQVKASNIHAESFYRIGRLTGVTVEIKNSFFNFAEMPQFSIDRFPDYLMQSDFPVVFQNCSLIYYQGTGFETPMNINGKAIFKDCYINNEFYVLGIPDERSTSIYENVQFYQFNGSIDVRNKYYIEQGNLNTGAYFFDYGKKISTYNYEGTGLLPSTMFSQERITTAPWVRYQTYGGVSLTVFSNYATATIPALAGYDWLVGKIVLLEGSLPTLEDGISVDKAAAMRIYSIDGSGNITFNRLAKFVATGTYTVHIPYYQKNGKVATGSVTTGSSTVSSVNIEGCGPCTYGSAGQPIRINDYLYTIVSTSAGTFTVDRNIAFTDANAIISPYEYIEQGKSNQNPLTNSFINDKGILFTKGSFYRNSDNITSSTILGWQCTRSGILATTNLPAFRPIYSYGQDSMYRKPGIDSIYFTINGIERAIIDSIGSASSGITSINSQTGSSQTIANGNGISVNSASNTHTITADHYSIDKQYADANNSGTSATDLYSKTVAANQLSADGNSLHFEASGTNNDATATVNLDMLFAGTTIAGTGSVTISATGVWSVKGMVMRTGSTTARAYVVITIDNSTQKVFSTSSVIGGLDFTTTNILKLRATAGGGGGGSNDITGQMWSVEFHK